MGNILWSLAVHLGCTWEKNSKTVVKSQSINLSLFWQMTSLSWLASYYSLYQKNKIKFNLNTINRGLSRVLKSFPS